MAKSRAALVGAFAVFALVVALYGPTLRGGFVYDSISQVLYSDYIHTPSHWGDVLTLRVVGQDELDRNRPLHLASLMLDAAIWGKDPLGYRTTSVLLHALNASLLFVFIALALQRTKPGGLNARAGFLCAAFGALVFALHPLVVEAVAEPSNREDLLVLLPMLIGLFCIIRSFPRSSFALSVTLTLCSFLAVLAKESGIAVPFVFAVGCWLFRRNDLGKCASGLIGGFAVAAAFLVASYEWRPAGSAIFTNSPQPLADNLLTILGVQFRIWTLQFWQIIWPWNLSAHYTADAIVWISLPVAIAVIAVVAVGAVMAWRSDRLEAVGIAVYALCLLPASNFAAQYHPIADRYLYVPLAGTGMTVAALTARLRIKCRSKLAVGLLAVLLLILLGLEYAANLRRQLIWQQPATLWSDVLRQYPGMSQALVGMANVYFRAGDYEAAHASATDAVAASSGRWADAWALRAICEWETGHRAAGMASFRQAQCLSHVYSGTQSMAAALIFSPDQLQILAEMSAEAR